MSLFEFEGEFYKPVRVGNFWNNNDIEYESNGDLISYIRTTYTQKS